MPMAVVEGISVTNPVTLLVPVNVAREINAFASYFENQRRNYQRGVDQWAECLSGTRNGVPYQLKIDWRTEPDQWGGGPQYYPIFSLTISGRLPESESVAIFNDILEKLVVLKYNSLPRYDSNSAMGC